MEDPDDGAPRQRRLERAQREHRTPSLVAGVVREGQLVWSGGAGEVEGSVPDADTQYRIGSITKTLVAVAVMRLRDEGRVALSDPIEAHLPGTGLQVSIGQLLMHAGGTPAETGGPWWERTAGGPVDDLVADLAARGPVGPADRRFHYSNVGFGLLGGVVERVRGRPWADVVAEEVLAPLGMTRTTPRPVAPAAPGLAVHPWADVVLPEPEHDAGAMAPAGQLWSTATDLGRWCAFLAGDVGEVLSPDTLAEMRVPGMVDDRPGEPWTTAWGLGLQVGNADGRRTVGHGGSMPGFLAVVQVEVETGLGLTAMANTTAGLDPALVGDLWDLARTHLAPAPAPWRPTAAPADVLELLGIWYWGPRAHVLRLADGELHLAPMEGSGRVSRFAPRDDGTWVGRDGYYAGEVLTAVRRGDGTTRHLDLGSFIFTRTPYDPHADVPGGVDPAGWR